MKRACILFLAMLLLMMAPVRGAAEVIDRILAIVNNTPVLLSEWEEAWRCEALLADRAPESYGETERGEVFDRLVDQELLQQQMRGYLLTATSAGDVDGRLSEVKAQLAGKTEAQWQALLRRAGVTENELKDRLRDQLEIEHFIDSRFRAAVRVDNRDIARYYRDQFLPQLQKAGGKEVPLDEVSGKIREILVQQRVSEQLTSWLQTLREQADIQIPAAINSDSSPTEVTESK